MSLVPLLLFVVFLMKNKALVPSLIGSGLFVRRGRSKELWV